MFREILRSMTSFPSKKKKSRDTQSVTTQLLTNLHTLTPTSDKTIFRYDIEILWRNEQLSGKVLSEQLRWSVYDSHRRNPNSSHEQSTLNQSLLKNVLEKYKLKGNYLYDGESVLYSTEDHRKNSTHAPMEILYMVLDAEALDDDILDRLPNRDSGKIEFRVLFHSQIDLNRFEYEKNDNIDGIDRNHLKLYEMLTNATAIETEKYVFYGANVVSNFVDNVEHTSYGTNTQQSYRKGVKITKGPSSSKSFLFYLDDAETLTYEEMNVKQFAKKILKHHKINIADNFPIQERKELSEVYHLLNNQLSGLFVYLEQDYGFQFSISGLSQKPIREIQVCNERGDQVSIVENNDWTDIDDSWPAVIYQCSSDRMEKLIRHFPLEHLVIQPHQTVPQHKQLGEPAEIPNVQKRFENIAKGLSSLSLNDGGLHHNHLENFGIKISEPLLVEAKELSAPVLHCVNQKRLNNKRKGMKNVDNVIAPFVEPAEPFVMYVIHTATNNSNYANFIESMLKEAVARGMNFGIVKMMRTSESKMKQALYFAQKYKEMKGIERMMVFLIHGQKKDKNEIHYLLKLFERRFETPTQHISNSVAKETTRRRSFRLNMLSKINCKMGGMNYLVTPAEPIKHIWISNAEAMVISYKVDYVKLPITNASVEASTTLYYPGVVGLASNTSKHPLVFVGDFHYQTPGPAQVSEHILESRFRDMFQKFQANRGKLPHVVIIYRGGLTESQQSLVIAKELQVIRKVAMEVYDHSPLPKFVVQILTKKHGIRFCEQNNNIYKNPEAGTVVDQVVVRPDIKEFYIQSHHCTLGTAKFVAVKVVTDELNISISQMEHYYNALANCHQIDCNPISLPEPVYLADVMTVRGKYLWEQHLKQDVTHKQENGYLYNHEYVDYEKMTDKLSYRNTKLDGIHISA